MRRRLLRGLRGALPASGSMQPIPVGSASHSKWCPLSISMSRPLSAAPGTGDARANASATRVVSVSDGPEIRIGTPASTRSDACARNSASAIPSATRVRRAAASSLTGV